MYQDLDCLYFLFRITLVDNCNDRHRIIQIIVDISSSCHTAKGEKRSYTIVDNRMMAMMVLIILQVMAKRYVMSEEMKNEILPALKKATNMHVYANKVSSDQLVCFLINTLLDFVLFSGVKKKLQISSEEQQDIFIS